MSDFNETELSQKIFEKYSNIKFNENLSSEAKLSDIVVHIKVKRLAWAGHLMRMSDERTLKKIFNTKPDGTRSVGRN